MKKRKKRTYSTKKVKNWESKYDKERFRTVKKQSKNKLYSTKNWNWKKVIWSNLCFLQV